MGSAERVTEYLSPSKAVIIVGGVFVGISPIVYLIASLIASDKLLPIVSGCCTAFVGLIMVCMTISAFVGARSNVKKYVSQYGENALCDDFSNARYFVRDTLKCGERFVYSKGRGVLLAYDDIIEIIRTKNHHNTVETGMNIYAKLKNGKRVLICSVFNADDLERELNKAVEYMMQHMPGVTVSSGII
ncbi:MAG: hypothetical protein IIZ46_08030 [Clostridia bacterium]|nr:hypothetical protein [Clostridia bacterium]